MGKVFKYILAFLVINLTSIYAFSQLQPCNPLDPCYARCMQGLSCNIDDPVPLDNELIFLVIIAAVFGLYKLNYRTPVKG